MQWLLFAATFVGAGYGGWRTAKRTGLAHDKAPACFLGGVLMALGAALAHGGNDSLFLNGLPLLQGHAIVSLTAMLATIAACSQLRHAISG